MNRWTPDYPNDIHPRRLMLTDHAVDRMRERQLTREQIAHVIKAGEYEWDYDYIVRYGFPWRLLSPERRSWIADEPLHDVVVLIDVRNGWIVTVWREDRPDPQYVDRYPQDVPEHETWHGRKLN